MYGQGNKPDNSTCNIIEHATENIEHEADYPKHDTTATHVTTAADKA